LSDSGGVSATALLARYINEMGGGLDVSRLKRMRSAIASSTFAATLEAEIAADSAAVASQARQAAIELRLAAGDRASERAAELKIIELLGVGGGASLVVGSLSAALTLQTPALALLPLLVAAYVIVHTGSRYRHVAEQARLFRSIEEELKFFARREPNG
jgi:hypothetical protein